MEKYIRILVLLIFEITVLSNIQSASITPEALLQDVKVQKDLLEHSEEFNKPAIIKVTKEIFVAVGYGIANTIFVLAPEGLIVVDTMESSSAASDIFGDFRKLHPDIPVKAVIYTHSHGDHNEGTRAFIKDAKNPPDIWAHSTLLDELKSVALAGPVLFKRGARQFGIFLPQEGPSFVNSGLGPRIVFEREQTQKRGITWPNKLVEGDEKDVVIAGLDMKLFHTPGETNDHLSVWIPSMGAFMCGDNLYKTFPNIYAIRGTTMRDTADWVNSLDKIRQLKPKHLLPSHTRPISGEKEVMQIVTLYRDGIQYVHDQTLRNMNKGYHREDIARIVQLPPSQQTNRYLREHYGTITWSSKAIYDRYIGWFTGFPEELAPYPPKEESKRIMKLAGGVGNMKQKAREALEQNDYQWALELATHAIRGGNTNDDDIVDIRINALKGLAGEQSSPNGRNYYLTSVLEDAGLVELKVPHPRNFAMHLPLEQLFGFLSTMVKPEVCSTTNLKLMLNLTDIHEIYNLHIRNGILQSVKVSGEKLISQKLPDNYIIITSQKWREVIGQIKTVKDLLTDRDVKISHRKLLDNFFKCFELIKPDYDFGFHDYDL